METSFKDKVVLVSGEANALTMGIIHSFLKEDAIVIYPAKSLHQVDALKAFIDIRHPENFITLLIDMQDFDKLIETCETITDKFGQIDIAVEIPEFSSCQKDLTETSIDEWNNMMETGMLPFFMGARIVLNLMKVNLSGMFVHITESRSFQNLPSCALARVALTTRIEMSKIFAEEAHRHGIRYYHLWAQEASRAGGSVANADSSGKIPEMISREIMHLYRMENYSTESAFQSFPKQLLHQQV